MGGMLNSKKTIGHGVSGKISGLRARINDHINRALFQYLMPARTPIGSHPDLEVSLTKCLRSKGG